MKEIYTKYLFAWLLSLCMSVFSFAQDRYQLGVMPSANMKFSLGDGQELNAKLESRQFLLDGPEGVAAGNGFRYERSDLELVYNRSLSPLRSIGAGYLFRVEEGSGIVHRFIQQYAIIQRLRAVRIAHRIRTDETFSREDVRFRFRYRISVEKPLNGLVIDPREFYLKFNNEYLPTLAAGDFDMEIRALATIGYNFSDDMKLETGLDYRAEQIISPDTEHQCWLALGWYYSF